MGGETPDSEKPSKLWAAFVPDTLVHRLINARNSSQFEEESRTMADELQATLQGHLQSKGQLESQIRSLEASNQNLRNHYLRVKAELDTKNESGQPKFEHRADMESKLSSIEAESRVRDLENQLTGAFTAIDQLEGTVNNQNALISQLQAQTVEQEAALNRLNLELRTKTAVSELNHQQFSSTLQPLLAEQGITIEARDLTTTSAFVGLLVREVEKRNKAIADLEARHSGISEAELKKLMADNEKLKQEVDALGKSDQTIVDLRAQVGELQAKLLLSHQREADLAVYKGQAEDLLRDLHSKEKIIKELSSTVDFLKNEGQGEGGMLGLTALLKKCKDDYNFLFAEYANLQEDYRRLQKPDALRKKSAEGMALEKRQSLQTSENRKMDEEIVAQEGTDQPLNQGQQGKNPQTEMLEVPTSTVFGWHLQRSEEGWVASYLDDADLFVEFTKGNEVRLSEKLENRIIEESPDVLSLHADVCSLMANLTLILRQV
jgi:hypothetical protein